MNKFIQSAVRGVKKFLASSAGRTCILAVVLISFGVFTAYADVATDFKAGTNAVETVSEQIAAYVPVVTKLCYAIAGVVAIIGAISVYVAMNNEEQDVKKKIMMVVGACLFLIAAANALPLFFGLNQSTTGN